MAAAVTERAEISPTGRWFPFAEAYGRASARSLQNFRLFLTEIPAVEQLQGIGVLPGGGGAGKHREIHRKQH